jgi:hypothetical protein
LSTMMLNVQETWREWNTPSLTKTKSDKSFSKSKILAKPMKRQKMTTMSLSYLISFLMILKSSITLHQSQSLLLLKEWLKKSKKERLNKINQEIKILKTSWVKSRLKINLKLIPQINEKSELWLVK